ncbi:MAG: hypothetical protein LLG42_05215 [Chloroflexi bacterium]|nr:hypothetical protein [Chloroflexota bacterium]
MRKQRRELVAFIQQCDTDARTIRRKERALALARLCLVLFAAMIGFYIFFNTVVDMEKTILVCNACLFRIANILNGCLKSQPRGQLFTGLYYASMIWLLFLFIVFAIRARNLPDKYVKDVLKEKQEAIEQLVELKKQIEEKELLLEEYRTAMMIM